MFCIHCGKKLTDDASFCSRCGAPIIRKKPPVTEPVVEDTPLVNAEQEAVATPVAETPENAAPVAETAAIEKEAPKADAVADEAEPAVAESATEAVEPTAENETAETETAEAPVEEPVADAAESSEDGEVPTKEKKEKKGKKEKKSKKGAAADESSDAEPADGEEPPKKKKKLGLLLGIGIPAVALIVAAAILLPMLLFPATAAARSASSSAYVTSGGVGVVVYENGQVLQLSDKVVEASMTPNRKHLVVLDKQGSLYVTDPTQTAKRNLITVDPNRASVHFMSNDACVIYTVNNGNGTVGYYRYDYDLDSTMTLYEGDSQNLDAIVVSDMTVSETVSFAYAEDGDIYLYGFGDVKKQKIAQYDADGEIRLLGLSSDGFTLAWAERDRKGNVNVSVQEEGEAVFSTQAAKDASLSMMLSPDAADLWVLTCGSELYYKQGKGQIRTVTLPADVHTYSICTENGLSVGTDANAANAKFLYFTTRETSNVSDKNANMLFCVRLETGDKIALASDVASFFVNSGTLGHCSVKGELYLSTLDKQAGTLAQTVFVDSDVMNVAYANGTPSYLYYIKNVKETVGELYIYDVKNGTPHLVDTGVRPELSVSEDGKTVYYYRSPKSATGTSENGDATRTVDFATLKCYVLGETSSRIIHESVIIGSLTSHRLLGEIVPNDMWFTVYQDIRATSYQYHIAYYNGETASLVVKNMTA